LIRERKLNFFGWSINNWLFQNHFLCLKGKKKPNDWQISVDNSCFFVLPKVQVKICNRRFKDQLSGFFWAGLCVSHQLTSCRRSPTGTASPRLPPSSRTKYSSGAPELYSPASEREEMPLAVLVKETEVRSFLRHLLCYKSVNEEACS